VETRNTEEVVHADFPEEGECLQELFVSNAEKEGVEKRGGFKKEMAPAIEKNSSFFMYPAEKGKPQDLRRRRRNLLHLKVPDNSPFSEVFPQVSPSRIRAGRKSAEDSGNLHLVVKKRLEDSFLPPEKNPRRVHREAPKMDKDKPPVLLDNIPLKDEVLAFLTPEELSGKVQNHGGEKHPEDPKAREGKEHKGTGRQREYLSGTKPPKENTKGEKGKPKERSHDKSQGDTEGNPEDGVLDKGERGYVSFSPLSKGFKRQGVRSAS
jgi:hypothetical protein